MMHGVNVTANYRIVHGKISSEWNTKTEKMNSRKTLQIHKTVMFFAFWICVSIAIFEYLPRIIISDTQPAAIIQKDNKKWK